MGKELRNRRYTMEKIKFSNWNRRRIMV